MESHMVLIFTSLIAKVGGHFSYAYWSLYFIFSELLIFLTHLLVGLFRLGYFEFLELFTHSSLIFHQINS